MGLSLRGLKEELIAKGGYTITPNHSQLTDLKELVDDMMSVRGESPPDSGPGSYSGTNCIGHQNVSDYNLSLGDINSLDIKVCSCHTVNDTTAYCRSRTYTCSCNSNAPTCTCNNRTLSQCDCQSRSGTCDCHMVTSGGNWCQCNVLRGSCSCDARQTDLCSCQNRTSSCGSRNTTSCTCNGRCACNAEKRFS